MAPAFSSTRQAAGFALLLFVLLLLPAMVGPRLLPPREEVYSSLGWTSGGWPYIQQQIYKEKQDIDIAFIGPSHLWYGIDDRYVQAKLSEQLGRPAVVRSFCWGVSGYDTIYFVAKDLLEHRKVHLLFFYDDLPEATIPHGRATHLFRFWENKADLQGLSWSYRINYYYAAIIGVPRNLLSWIRPSRSSNLDKDNTFTFLSAKTENIVERLGSLGVREGFSPSEFGSHGPYEEFTPQMSPPRTDVAVYPDINSQEFQFVSEQMPSLQMHFIQKFTALATQHHTTLAMMCIPMFDGRRDQVMTESDLWSQAIPNLTIVGISPARMFNGMSDADVEKLYFDRFHFNECGQEYFTKLITPGLLQAYAKKISH